MQEICYYFSKMDNKPSPSEVIMSKPEIKRLSFRVPKSKNDEFERLAEKLGSKKTTFIANCALVGLNFFQRQLEPETMFTPEMLRQVFGKNLEDIETLFERSSS